MPVWPVVSTATTTKLPCGAVCVTAPLLDRIWETTGADVAGEHVMYLCRMCHEFHYLVLR